MTSQMETSTRPNAGKTTLFQKFQSEPTAKHEKMKANTLYLMNNQRTKIPPRPLILPHRTNRRRTENSGYKPSQRFDASNNENKVKYEYQQIVYHLRP